MAPHSGHTPDSHPIVETVLNRRVTLYGPQSLLGLRTEVRVAPQSDREPDSPLAVETMRFKQRNGIEFT